MKNLYLLILFLLLCHILKAQNVGIGTSNPQTKLHVDGALSLSPVTLTASTTPFSLPDNVSVVIIENNSNSSANGSATVTNPKEGQILTIYNNDAQPVVFSGLTIAANNGVITCIYVNGGWRLISDNTANNYIHPNHTGDVTSSGDGATVISNNAVTGAKILDGTITNADINDVAWGKITGKPTTISGYGITDATPNNRTITITPTTNQTTVSGGTQDLSTNRTWIIGTAQDIATTSSPTFNNVTSTGNFIGRNSIIDTRAINAAPSTYSRQLAYEFKQRTTIGSPGTGTYGGLITIAPWSDNTGGNDHQLFFNNGGIFYRQGTAADTSASGWGAWSQILTSSNNPNISGNTNYVSKFTSANTIGNSQIFDNGSNVGIGVSNPNDKFEVVEGIVDFSPSSGWSQLNVGRHIDAKFNEAYWGGTSLFLGWSSTKTILGPGSAAGDGFGGPTTLGAASDVWSKGTMGIGNNLLVSGNTGLGTTSPASKLHVGGIASGNGILIGNYNDRLGWNGSGNLPYFAIRFAGYRDVVNNFTGAMIAGVRTNICCSGLSQGMDLSFFVQPNTATVSGDGNLLERARVNGSGMLAWDYYYLSDKRLKSEVSDIQYGLNHIMQVKPVSYQQTKIKRFNSQDIFDSNETEASFGFIAQDLYKIIPEIVNKPRNEDELWSVSYGKLTPILVKAIQEQQQQIEKLQQALIKNGISIE